MLNPIRQLGDRFSRGWQARAPADAVRALGAASKPLVRDGVAELLSRLGATSPARFARGALTIITFHRVLPADNLRQYPLRGLALTPEQLELVLGELAPRFECSSVSEAFRRWKSAAASPARPPLGISFDDGALDNYEHARPVLDKLSLSATFYVPLRNVEQGQSPWHDRLSFALLRSVAVARKARSRDITRSDGVDFDLLLAPFGLSVSSFAAILPDDALRLASEAVLAAKRLPPRRRDDAIDALVAALPGDPVADFARMMSWDQVRELQRAGHEIGAHALTHPQLPELPDAGLKEELAEARQALSDASGARVSSFCYPDAQCDPRVLAALRAAGYECTVTTRWGLNRERSAFDLARCDMDFARLCSRHGEFSRERLWLRLSGLQPGLAESAR